MEGLEGIGLRIGKLMKQTKRSLRNPDPEYVELTSARIKLRCVT